MKINEVEQIIGITKKNIRFYEDQGLLHPSRNNDNGYREYGEEDLKLLNQIKLLRKLGIPIEDIKKLQGNYLTLTDCLKRQMICLEAESRNITSVQTLCTNLLNEDVEMDTLDVSKYLTEMSEMEQGGTRFMNIQKKDKKEKKRSAYIASYVIIGFMIIMILMFIWLCTLDMPPIPLLIFLLAGPVIVIVGTILALRERMKEIEGGEMDEASKY